jgi:hypothetical protein
MSTDFKSLREKIEKSPQSSHELNLEIMKLLKFADSKAIVDGDRYKIENSRHSSYIINYTNSIDSALRLIPGNFKLMELSDYVGPWQGKISERLKNGIGVVFAGSHDYPAMAIVIAALRAMEHNESRK